MNTPMTAFRQLNLLVVARPSTHIKDSSGIYNPVQPILARCHLEGRVSIQLEKARFRK